MQLPEFHAWGKTARVDSPVVVTEKIDGTNGVIYVDFGDNPHSPVIWVGARNGWIAGISVNGAEFVRSDHYGFAGWATANRLQIARLLGHGYHYGEWWGQGIARGYGQDRKRFQLFDIRHSEKDGWDDDANEWNIGTVPVLYDGPMDHRTMERQVELLQRRGSVVAPGYLYPEGLVVRFSHNGVRFKKVIDKVGPQVQRVFKDKPPKRKWTEEEIDAARAAAFKKAEDAYR